MHVYVGIHRTVFHILNENFTKIACMIGVNAKGNVSPFDVRKHSSLIVSANRVMFFLVKWLGAKHSICPLHF